MKYAPLTETRAFELVGQTEGGSTLRAGDRLVPEPVDGSVLEAQFAVGEFGLVVLSDDCPFEEELHFRLLDASLRSADALDFAAVHTPGVFTLVAITDAPGISFTFGGEEVYELLVHIPPRRGLGSSVRGVRRRSRWFSPHYLEIHAA